MVEYMSDDITSKNRQKVYYLDLKNDTAEVLKLNKSANIAKILGTQTRTVTRYSTAIQDYCERYVYRYQSTPNKDGFCHFDGQVLRLIVDVVKNGKEAVDKFASMPSGYYDFIFMDIMMPVMDGLEATRQIRALERSDAKTIPILAMTTNAFQDDIRQSIEAGMNDHLMKPLDAQKIKQAIQEAVR